MKILNSFGKNFEIIDYIKFPLSSTELKDLSNKMGVRPRDFIRTRESTFKDLKLQNYIDDDEALFKYMSKNPKLIERPIVVYGNRAVLARPVDKIKNLIGM